MCVLLNFYRYYVGSQPYMLVSDLDMLKQIMIKDFDNFTDRLVRMFCNSHLDQITSFALYLDRTGLVTLS